MSVLISIPFVVVLAAVFVVACIWIWPEQPMESTLDTIEAILIPILLPLHGFVQTRVFKLW